MNAESCLNCEEPIGHGAVYFDGRPYCCVGCVAGGPCHCTYTDAPPQTAPPAYSGARRTTAAAPGAALAHAPHLEADRWIDEAPREPIPFRRPGMKVIVVHATGFPDQASLLKFAAEMENTDGFSEVSLTRVNAWEAWFTVGAGSAQDVAATLNSFHGFEVENTVDEDLVMTRVSSAHTPPSERPEEPTASEQPGIDALLPPRQRFRVYRPGTHSTPTRPAAPPPTHRPPPEVPAPAPQRPAAEETPPPAPPAPEIRPAARWNDLPEPQQRHAAPAPAPFTDDLRPAMPAAWAPPTTTPAPVAPPAPAASPPPAASPAPAAPPRATEVAGDDRMVEPEERPGGAVATAEHLTLVVYPFHSFAGLNDFQAAVRGLRGVTNTRVRRFYRGTLHLAVDYEDMIPLSDRLRDIKDVVFEVASESRTELEIVLQDTGVAAAAGSEG